MRVKIEELVLKQRNQIAKRIKVRLLSYQKIDEADFTFLKRYPEYFKDIGWVSKVKRSRMKI